MNKTSLVFTGDIGFDKYMDHMWEKQDLLTGEVRDFLQSGDHLVVNVEGPLSEQKKITAANGEARLTHSMSPDAAAFLQDIGADIWNLCNNHIMDAGADGLSDTLGIAKSCGALTLGAGMNIADAAEPVILPEAGGIGLVAVGYSRACRIAGEDTPGCLNWSDMASVEKAIKKVKKTCRWCVLVAHDGEEFTALPLPYTRNRYRHYLELGADVVVAHHPHVPMNYETVQDKVIFYSLGNFVFDTDYQRAQFNTEKGLFIKLNFDENKFTFEPFGIFIDREKEQICKGELPGIFVDVNQEEYERLVPLAAKVLIENTKRQLKYLKPGQFENASEQDWHDNFYEPLRSGRVPGEILDFQIIYPLSLEAESGTWKTSSLESVKKYMLEQIETQG